MMEHKWKYIDEQLKSEICKICGQLKTQILLNPCSKQKEANDTHCWKDNVGSWKCEICGINGFFIFEGPGLAIDWEIGDRPITCEEIIMRKALE